jgi:TolB protein
MRFAEALLDNRSRGVAVLAASTLLVVSTAAGAAPRSSSRPPKSIGGVTAVPVKLVRVTGAKNPVYDPRYTDRRSKHEFRPLYAGNTITTDSHGEADFTLQLKGKTLYCSIRGVGPEPGILTVSPRNGDAMYLQNGTLLCATSATGTPEQISVEDVTVKVVDPVFTIAATKQRVVLKLRRGAAKVTGANPRKGVVAALSTRQARQQKLQTIVVPVGGNPTQPATTTLPLDPAIAGLEQKAPPAPPPPPVPPIAKFGTNGFPPDVNGASPFSFTFASDPYVSTTLFSCSLNGGPSYACTSGQPQKLPPGLDTFTVRATDAAGTVGPAVSRTWFQERAPDAPIAFQSNQSGKFQLYQIDPDGGNLRRLTSATGFDPAWSPDGTQIAFESNRNAGFGSEIYVQTVGTNQAVRLTRNPANDRTPRWSPDGTQIVFASNRTGTYQIYVTAADGSSRNKPTQLTFSGENSDPAWSTTNKIAFEHTPPNGKPEIYVMKPDGSGQRRLASQGSDLNPSWSPNSKSIVFDSGRSGNEQIYVMNADGSRQRRLTFDDARDSNPVFSPDGRRIAFSSDRSGTLEVWIMSADGKNLSQLTTTSTASLAPTW